MSQVTSTAIRGRYAPSPTGELHLGNLRTALLAWLFARRTNGTFILRVEDLDLPRVRPGASESMLADLRWLGLDWDEGPDNGGPFAPYTQSERKALYEEHLERLIASDLVYPCYCSRAEIAQAASAPQQGAEEGPRYPGTCRKLTRTQRAQLARQRRPALRFRVEDERVVSFHDLIVGPSAQHVQNTVGDFVVRRADGIFAYQFAVVVDDGLMQINQVVRGADLLSSTARQLLLYEALAMPKPAFAHVPLVLDEQGKRFAKRNASAGLAPLRASGTTAAQVVGALAASCGLLPSPIPTSPIELAQQFMQMPYDIMRTKLQN